MNEYILVMHDSMVWHNFNNQLTDSNNLKLPTLDGFLTLFKLALMFQRFIIGK